MNEWSAGSQTDEPTLEDVAREFPHLICRRADISGRYYAFPRDGEMGEPLAGPAEDPRDLRDGIIAAEALAGNGP